MSLPVLRLPSFRHRQPAASFTLASGLALFLIVGAIAGDFAAPAGRAFGNLPLRIPAIDREDAPVDSTPELSPIAPQKAQAINAAVPISNLANPPALPFILSTSNAVDRERATDCLATAIYYEAATEPLGGQRAVAQVVLNRLRHPAFPKTVCGVVYQGSERKTGCQFTFTCDGSLDRPAVASYWKRAWQVAEQALAGSVYEPVGWATHYHTDWVAPDWSSSLVKVAVVGAHIFYRWKGDWGQPGSFHARYACMEPDVDKWRQAATVNVAQGEAGRSAFVALASAPAGSPGPVTSTNGLFQAAFPRNALASMDGSARVAAPETGKRAAAAGRLRWKLTGVEGSEVPQSGSKAALATETLGADQPTQVGASGQRSD